MAWNTNADADEPATTVYGTLLWRHHEAARKDIDGLERKRLFDLIEAFRAEFPDECKALEDRYAPDVAKQVEDEIKA